VGKPAISYAPHASATPEAEASVLSAVYLFLIKSKRQGKGRREQRQR
jgi:hypothetical protein